MKRQIVENSTTGISHAMMPGACPLASIQAITTKYRESDEFVVDMTRLVFHIGKTPVSYTVHHGSKSSHVDFHLFQYKNGKMDSFSDPIDLGFELPGGTKYDYKPRTVTFYFKPVK